VTVPGPLGWPRWVGKLDVRVPSPCDELRDDRVTRRNVRLFLKRDDLIHPEISGNKWRKLDHNLAAAADGGHQAILTFGGAYSNHIRAVAAAGHYFGFRSIGVIRGEERLPLNWSLAYAVSRGMKLAYLDRITYRHKTSTEVIERLREQHGDFYLLPEGGSNNLAVLGCAELPAEISFDFDIICCPCGTGGTLAGIAAGLGRAQTAIGFSALKGCCSLEARVTELQREAGVVDGGNWTIDHDFHFGGFARRTSELEGFIEDFKRRHGLALERVYVAKMMYGVFARLERGDWPPGAVVQHFLSYALR